MSKKQQNSKSETVTAKDSSSDFFDFPASNTMRERAKRYTKCIISILTFTRFCKNKKKHN